MTTTLGLYPQPLVLVATDDDLSADTLQRLLAPYGFAVTRVRTGQDALEPGSQMPPDAVVADLLLPDMNAIELCQRLRHTVWLAPGTPIVVTARRDVRAHERYALFRVGAWDVIREPVDPPELLLRLRNYVAAKRAVDQAREEGLVDPLTGLYNWKGLVRRGREVTAEAFRRHAALACLAVTADAEGVENLSPEELEQTVSRMGRILRTLRQSDVVGRHNGTEFGIIAPRTNADGAVNLAQRLLRNAYTDLGVQDRPLQLRIGYEAVPNMHEMPMEPDHLLEDALRALHRIPRSGTGLRIQPFRPFEHRRPETIS